MSHLSDLLKKKPKTEKEVSEELKMLALQLAMKSLTVAGGVGAFTDEDGNLDYSKAIPTVPWVT